MLRRGGTCLLLTAALTSCGSRSNLLAESDEGAGGGAVTSSTTGSSTSSNSSTSSTSAAGGGGSTGNGGGGTGGSPGDCSVLEIAGPPASLDGGFGQHQRHPVWTLSSDDGARVTLLSEWQAAEGPAGGEFPRSVIHTSLEPWFDFPSGGVLGPNDVASEAGGDTFAAARASGGRFAAVFADPEPPDGGLVFGGLFTPFTPDLPTAYSMHPTAERALFVAQGPSFAQPLAGHLVGMSIRSAAGDAYAFRAGLASASGPLLYPVDLACASGPLHADAVGTSTGWLLALSNGNAFAAPECFDPGPGLGWPSDVQIAFATHEGSYVQTDFLGAPGGATELKMAPRSDGAWVVVGTPPGQVVSGMYLGARVSLEGKVLSTFQVGGGDPSQEIMVEGTLAAAGVNDWLAVAWIDMAGDKGPFLRVKTFDPEGNPGGHVEIFSATSFDGTPSLLGSPITNSLVLAWSETPEPGSFDGNRMRAVRIDCVAGE